MQMVMTVVILIKKISDMIIFCILQAVNEEVKSDSAVKPDESVSYTVL